MIYIVNLRHKVFINKILNYSTSIVYLKISHPHYTSYLSITPIHYHLYLKMHGTQVFHLQGVFASVHTKVIDATIPSMIIIVRFNQFIRLQYNNKLSTLEM